MVTLGCPYHQYQVYLAWVMFTFLQEFMRSCQYLLDLDLLRTQIFKIQFSQSMIRYYF